MKPPLWIVLPIILISLLSSFFLIGGSFFTKEIFAFTVFTPTIEKTEEIQPKESISIFFPKPVFDTEYRESVQLSPSQPFYAKWENNRTKLILTPQTYWNPETNYTLMLPEGTTKNPFSAKPQAAVFQFKTIPLPTIKNISPQKDARDIIIDIEDPIIVEFDSPLKDYWIDFVFSPTIDVTFQNNPEKTRFEILPKTALIPGTTYTLTLFVRIQKEDTIPNENKQIFQTQFTTLALAPEKLSQNPAERLRQVKQFTQPKIDQGKYIDINLSEQVMIIFENGLSLDAYLISSGKKGMDTPKGSYQIHNKHPRPWSKQYALFMPYWMAITSDGKYGIHELPEWPGGYKEGANHLGTPVSHGCVRLGINSAERVYNWAEMGTPVIIH